ncbi:MAG TPA: hypothetical protein VNU26_09215, partial [Mycobacteriales bacterium]|nr:hypothetical protein [Mycobacteriales bacterium]
PLALAGALLAVPVALGVLPGAAAAPSHPKAATGLATSSAASSGTATSGGGARVVVGVIDSGVNPYHEAFQVETSSVTSEVLAEFGISADQVVTLTRTGDPAADYAADKARVWDRIRPGTPYWFSGTNIIAASFDPGSRPVLPDDADDTHGVGVTAAVLAANPEAVVAFAEGITDDSEAWAFTHPAVDVVTTSYGVPGSLPLGLHLERSYTGVVELGKLHTGASDNSPAFSGFDGTSGPWWALGIAGFQEGSTEGRQLLSGNVVDFVADFTQRLPYCDLCQSRGEQNVSGTSFATPTSAGVVSKVLLEARRAAGHAGGIVTEGVEQPLMVAAGGTTLTNWQLRRALEEAAYIPRATDFSPGGGLFDLTSAPVVDAAGWAQTGWGALTADPEHGVVEQALGHLGIGGEPTRTKGDDYCTFGTAQFELRKAYWDEAALFSDSAGADADPYLRC